MKSYSGTITCEYLANKAPKGLKWAISGRDKAKLVELKKELESIDSQLSNLEIFVVDATNYDQVKSLAEKTKVLISFVGMEINFSHIKFYNCSHRTL